MQDTSHLSKRDPAICDESEVNQACLFSKSVSFKYGEGWYTIIDFNEVEMRINLL